MPAGKNTKKKATEAHESSISHNTLLSFRELMHLTPVTLKRAQIDVGNATTFMSKRIPWQPGPAAYGGHVYAQSVWAASQTLDDKIEKGMVVHVCSGAVDVSRAQQLTLNRMSLDGSLEGV